MGRTIKYKKNLLTLSIGVYSNGELAIRTYNTSKGYLEPYANLTVNLDTNIQHIELDKYCAYIDVENLSNDILEVLVKENLGNLTGKGIEITSSFGSIVFPEFKFNKEALLKFDEDNVEEYDELWEVNHIN